MIRKKYAVNVHIMIYVIYDEWQVDELKQSFYVYNNGDLKRKDNTLQFTAYEGIKRDIPIERISDIYVMSEMSFNTVFLNYVAQYQIPIHFLITIISIQEAFTQRMAILQASFL